MPPRERAGSPRCRGQGGRVDPSHEDQAGEAQRRAGLLRPLPVSRRSPGRSGPCVHALALRLGNREDVAL